MSGKVIAIMSAVAGNGAKYVATNLAKTIKRSKKTDHSVLLIDFDFDNPYLAYDMIQHDTTHGLDNLTPMVHESGVSSEIFLENVISTRINVDVLRGTHFVGKTKQFTRQHIEGILKRARELYDFVLVVVTPKMNNAGTVYSLFHCDQVVLVLRDNYSNLLRVDRALHVISQYARSEADILIVYNYQNMYAKSVVNDKLSVSPLPFKVAAVLEYDERTIDNVDLEKKDSIFAKPTNMKAFSDVIKLMQ